MAGSQVEQQLIQIAAEDGRLQVEQQLTGLGQKMTLPVMVQQLIRIAAEDGRLAGGAAANRIGAKDDTACDGAAANPDCGRRWHCHWRIEANPDCGTIASVAAANPD
jgi:hypothetical protein